MIIVCGEILVDLVPASCVGESGYVPRAGGSPYNVAIGLGRLGIPVGFIGRVSRDLFGRMLRDRLAANAVDLSYLVEGNEPTTLALVHLAPDSEPEFTFYGEGTADRMLVEGDLPSAFPDDTTAMHFGSISLVREPAASAFEACMRREHGRRLISLDPNVRAGLIPDRMAYLERLAGWLSLADLVKTSRADLSWLYPDIRTEDIAHDWLARGPGLVVVTQGDAGAAAFAHAGSVEVGGVPTVVADTVGAGDAFTSGLLAWLSASGRLERSRLRELDAAALRNALSFANSIASLTCAQTGAEPPTRAALTADGAAWLDG